MRCLKMCSSLLRSSLVFSTFRSAMESDMVWERFLQFDYSDIVSRSLTPFNFSSKKQLFQCLCNPLLIGGGKLSFNLEKSSRKKSYLLSARALSITWSNDPLYWCWVHMTKSRFSEVAVLRITHWLEIEGTIKTGMLSSNTKYGAYLVIKIRHNAYGLDLEKAELSVQVGDGQAWTGLAYLFGDNPDRKNVEHLRSSSRLTEVDDDDDEEQILKEREDGWMEIELGEFFNGDDDQEVKMSFKEVKSYHLKGGLIVEGVELFDHNVTVVSDSCSAVAWVNGDGFGNLNLIQLIYDIRDFLLKFRAVSIVFRPRDANSVADSLAKMGSSSLHLNLAGALEAVNPGVLPAGCFGLQ
ncbi:hypothetical protein EZV62_006459 [Acer yangbiense]|uniref:RNase H type-1 domain-containing protein n=1 Tax=Acer yangbiense TaxID=1000413 RepID=A0A5C7I7P1_9ROSI|nr:hypothetical protein EZV62_006459 [Acer yangbiense]